MNTNQSTPLLELDSVVKRYGSGPTEVRALTDVSLTVEPGEMVAIMGPSGCGKSTLLHLAGALEEPDAGTVRVAGRDLATLDMSERASLRRRNVGYVFQRLNLVPTLTALENVVLPLELNGMSRREARDLALAALDAVGISEQVNRFPDDFSGGQQQRIAVARGIVGDRDLLLADEPTGSLDTLTGNAVIDLIAGLPAFDGTAVVLVTHEPRYASYADRVVFLRDGRIVDDTGDGQSPPPADSSHEPGPDPGPDPGATGPDELPAGDPALDISGALHDVSGAPHDERSPTTHDGRSPGVTTGTSAHETAIRL
jgi:putative ABC transport system ATP-binding protein